MNTKKTNRVFPLVHNWTPPKPGSYDDGWCAVNLNDFSHETSEAVRTHSPEYWRGVSCAMAHTLGVMAYSNTAANTSTTPPCPFKNNTPEYWAFWQGYNDLWAYEDFSTEEECKAMAPPHSVNTIRRKLQDFDCYMERGKRP